MVNECFCGHAAIDWLLHSVIFENRAIIIGGCNSKQGAAAVWRRCSSRLSFVDRTKLKRPRCDNSIISFASDIIFQYFQIIIDHNQIQIRIRIIVRIIVIIDHRIIDHQMNQIYDIIIWIRYMIWYLNNIIYIYIYILYFIYIHWIWLYNIWIRIRYNILYIIWS